MQQIADWLQKLGLGQYAERFAENGIDVSVLRYLTDQDLEKIGVLLGHRRKMLAAITGVSGGPAAVASTPTAATPAAPEPALPPIATAAEIAGERRYLTVMFCDLVVSLSRSPVRPAWPLHVLTGRVPNLNAPRIFQRQDNSLGEPKCRCYCPARPHASW